MESKLLSPLPDGDTFLMTCFLLSPPLRYHRLSTEDSSAGQQWGSLSHSANVVHV
jgi:hypothetical protein